ncbi:MAG: type II secretion system protein [Ruminococcus sp.]|nr:type II secretion system protein [Ruminococcus sp.]
MRNSNKKGFTLVELVVVIAIIGVLAAILVPSMMGYVKKSRVKTANGNAKTAYNAAAEAFADLETAGKLGKDVSDAIDNGWHDAQGEKGDAVLPSEGEDAGEGEADNQKATYVNTMVANVLAENGKGSGRFAVIEYGDAFAVLWHKDTPDSIVGMYPDPPADVKESENLFGDNENDAITNAQAKAGS